MNPGCTANNVWTYEVIVLLLSVPNTDGVCTVSIRQPIILLISVQSNKARDTTHVHSNVVHICVSNHVYYFVVKSSSRPNTLLSM